MTLKSGLFTMSNDTRHPFDASKAQAKRVRVSYNLINRTHKGFLYEG